MNRGAGGRCMRDKGLATAVATLLAAFATAHLMQFGLSAGQAISADEQVQPIGLATFVAQRGVASAQDSPAGPRAFPRAVPEAEPLRLPLARDLPEDKGVPGGVSHGAHDSFGQPCDRSLTVTAEPGALLDIVVHAPCDPGVRVEIGHAGFSFAEAIAPNGRLRAILPAMMAAADVDVSFADGTRIESRTLVPEVERVRRIALAFDATAALSLHAHDFGARTGGPGHGQLSSMTGEGEVQRLGDPGIEAPRLVEVYTFPSRRFATHREARVLVEAKITQANCSRDVAALVIRSSEDGMVPERTPLRLAMPACEAAGDILVIEFPMAALRIAGN